MNRQQASSTIAFAPKRILRVGVFGGAILWLWWCAICGECLHGQTSAANQTVNLDQALRALLNEHGVQRIDTPVTHSSIKVRLGKALFFDRELSGNRDTSCATCHHPKLASGDALALSVGVGPQNPGAIGPQRIKGEDREFIPRNATEMFNRASVHWTSQFWDSRVAQRRNGTFISPAGADLLPGLESVLSVQAMFPVNSRDEMRGHQGDLDVFGNPNELGEFDDADLHGIWSALMQRLMAIDGYRRLFARAFPNRPLDELTFADAANAIAAFETKYFTTLDSPFDQYLDGDDVALTTTQKQGGILFYGKAGCVQCHSGTLMTDQQHHNIGTPQLGPGKGSFKPLDLGRFLVNSDPRDMFAFRTPPLRNVAETGPWMHNGAYGSDLGDVIRHHRSPVVHLLSYQPKQQLSQTELHGTVLRDRTTQLAIIGSLDLPLLPQPLSQTEVSHLVEFLHSLTAPDLHQRLLDAIPQSVPSGLPIDGQ